MKFKDDWPFIVPFAIAMIGFVAFTAYIVSYMIHGILEMWK